MSEGSVLITTNSSSNEYVENCSAMNGDDMNKRQDVAQISDLIKSEESPDSSLQDGGKKGGKIDKQNGGKILGGKMRIENGASSECNITNFEEAAVSLSFALRVVRTCEDLMLKSEVELLYGKLCTALRTAAHNLTEASTLLENYINSNSSEYGEIEEVKFDINNFMKAEEENKILQLEVAHGDERLTSNTASSILIDNNVTPFQTDFKKYDMKVETVEDDLDDPNHQDALDDPQDTLEDNLDDNPQIWNHKQELQIDHELKTEGLKKKRSAKLKCSECPYTAKKSSNLKTHIEAKHLNNMYSCVDCEFTTTTLAYLRVHKHKHTVMAEKRHFCDQCNLSFNRNSRLLHHISVIHEGARLTCSQCDYTCKYHSNLKEHVNRVHKGIVFKCELCSYQTGSDKNLKVHISASHETGEFSCESCEYIAQSKTRLQYHVNTVHKGKVFVRKKVTFFCDQCSASFSSQKLLDIHIEVKHGTAMFNCTECKYSTKSEFYLHRHIKKHRAQVLYCDQCDYSTQVKELFKVHQNKHTGVTFKCTSCQFESHSKFNLGQHVKKVHEKSSVGCPSCSFVATAQVYLRRHIKKVHPQTSESTPS